MKQKVPMEGISEVNLLRDQYLMEEGKKVEDKERKKVKRNSNGPCQSEQRGDSCPTPNLSAGKCIYPLGTCSPEPSSDRKYLQTLLEGMAQSSLLFQNLDHQPPPPSFEKKDVANALRRHLSSVSISDLFGECLPHWAPQRT